MCNHTLLESDFIDVWDCSPRLQDDETLEICSNYIVRKQNIEIPFSNRIHFNFFHNPFLSLPLYLQNHGFCHSMSSCKKSHDVCRAVLLEDQKKSKKRKRKDESNAVPKEVDVFVETASTFSRQERFKGHRAGHDAFMTAFCFASFIAQKTSTRPDSVNTVNSTCWKDLVADVRNRICLSGKDFPLLIQKSTFSKCSKFHLDKYSRLVSEQPDLGS